MITQDAGEQQLLYFLQWFQGATAFLVLSAFLLAVVITLVFKPLKWVWLTLLVYVSTLGADATMPWFKNTLFSPLFEMRSYDRPLMTGLLILLLVPTLASNKGWRSRLLMAAVPLFFGFQVLMTARMAVGGVMARAVFGLIIWVLTFVVVGVGLSRWIQSRQDAYRVLWCVAVAGLLVAAGTACQLVINRWAVVLNGRLYGTTSNPNTLGYMAAIFIPTFLLLIIRRQGTSLARLGMLVGAGLMVVFMLWTGSRAGLLSSIISVAFLFRRRVGRSLLVALGCTVVVLLVLQVWNEVMVDRLVSTQDTRSAAWSSMWQAFLQHPLFGEMESGFFVQENLYLAVAARFGLLGLVLFVPAMVYFAVAAVRLEWSAAAMGQDATLADYVAGIVTAILVVSLFDAQVLGQFSFTLMTLFIAMAVAAYFRDERAVWGLQAEGRQAGGLGGGEAAGVAAGGWAGDGPTEDESAWGGAAADEYHPEWSSV